MGILLSLKGGVMKPMRNCALLWLESGSGAMEGVIGIDVGTSDESKRVARFRTFTRSGKSDDDFKGVVSD